MRNASNKEQVDKQREVSDRRRERELDDLKSVLGTEQGRRVVWRLLERTGVYRSSFTGNSETFFREGERNIGLYLMKEIEESSPESLEKMMTESRKLDLIEKTIANGKKGISNVRDDEYADGYK